MSKIKLLSPLINVPLEAAVKSMKKASAEAFSQLENIDWNAMKTDVDNFIDDFNMDKFFDESEKKLRKSIEKARSKFVKESATDLVITIPYDRNTDILDTTIGDNQFKAVAKSEDGTQERSTSIYIPEDVDVDSVTRSYDAEKHVMTFTFKKKA